MDNRTVIYENEHQKKLSRIIPNGKLIARNVPKWFSLTKNHHASNSYGNKE